MIYKRSVFSLVLLLLLPSIGGAETIHRAPPMVFRAGVVREGQPRGVRHLVYGEIAKISGHVFLMRLRGGRTLMVDDAIAISTGRFSAPLFIGKAIAVQGQADEFGVIHATSIERMEAIDASVGPDR